MRRSVLDTGVVLLYIRENDLYQTIESQNKLTDADSLILISVVTKAELLSLSKQLGWQEKKQKRLERVIDDFLVTININKNDKQLLEAYTLIDAYSQGKLSKQPLELSSRNMGKNDLWIAATAYITNSSLITLDNDFDHLNKSFINVIKYSSRE